MTKWKLHTIKVKTVISPIRDPEEIWTRKDKKTGRTEWDDVQTAAGEGWELVSVTAINSNGYTNFLLYTYKKPIEEGS